MTDTKKRSVNFSDEIKGPATTHGDFSIKTIRRVHPLGMRILVRIQNESNVTDGGLYLPEGAKNSTAESILAEVIEVASALDDHTHEETNISGIPLGTTVLIGRDSGVKVPWDEKIRIVDSKDVLGIVNEVSLS